MASCEHKEPRDSLKGAGPCDIRFEVLKRNGKPNWWCHAHGMSASTPDGGASDACPGSWFDPVAPEMQLEVDLATEQVSLWGALLPAIVLGEPRREDGKVHVHRRRDDHSHKDIDRSYDIVRLRHAGHELLVEGKAAVAYSVSELMGRDVKALRCSHCRGLHIDEVKFATNPHSKHLCNSCGRNFRDRAPSVSNPLADAHGQLGLPAAPAAVPAERHLSLEAKRYRTVEIWPSNRAIVTTMIRPEETGIHAHAWDNEGRLVIDETYGTVDLNGERLDEDLLRLLSVQRHLQDGAPIISLPCGACGVALVDRHEGWVEPSTRHSCGQCGHETRTRRRVFLNPLAEKFPDRAV